MSWLTKIGQVVLKVVGIATGLLPLVSAALPATAGVRVVEDRLTAAFKSVITVEQMFSAAYQKKGLGGDKLKAATPFVAQLVESVVSELPNAGHPKDIALFQDAVTRMTSAMADVLNAYGD